MALGYVSIDGNEAASSMVTYLVAMRLFDGWGVHP